MASKTLLFKFTKDHIYKAFEKTKEQFVGRLVLITEDKYDLVIRFLRDNYVPYEPVCDALGLDKESKDFELMFRKGLESNMSIAVQDIHTGKIISVIGINIANIYDEPDLLIYKDPKTKLFVELIDMTNKKGNVFKHYDVTEVVAFNRLAVSVEHRKRGLASILIKAALYFVKNLCASPIYVTTDGSYIFSQKCIEKNGFESLYDFRYDEFLKDGVQMIPNIAVHKSVIVYGQYLA